MIMAKSSGPQGLDGMADPAQKTLEALVRSFVQAHPEETAYALETLDPGELANLFETLPPDVVRPVTERLTPYAVAAILSRVGPERSLEPLPNGDQQQGVNQGVHLVQRRQRIHQMTDVAALSRHNPPEGSGGGPGPEADQQVKEAGDACVQGKPPQLIVRRKVLHLGLRIRRQLAYPVCG